MRQRNFTGMKLNIFIDSILLFGQITNNLNYATGEK